MVHLLDNVVGALQKLPPLAGEHHPLVHPVKQAHVELLLQQADLHRHRRLGVAQAGRRLGKALKLGHPDKGGDLPQFHANFPLSPQIEV